MKIKKDTHKVQTLKLKIERKHKHKHKHKKKHKQKHKHKQDFIEKGYILVNIILQYKIIL